MNRHKLFQFLFVITGIPVVIGLFVFSLAVMALFTSDGGVGKAIQFSFLGAAWCAPFGAVYWLKKSTGNAGRADFQSQATSAGATRQWFGERSGIAISSANSKIVVSQDGETRTYGFDDIRKWTTNLDSSWAAGTGMAGAQAHLAVDAQRYENTGLFVQVKDVDHPEWHIRIQKKPELNRWFEILTQTVNEGAKV